MTSSEYKVFLINTAMLIHCLFNDAYVAEINRTFQQRWTQVVLWRQSELPVINITQKEKN